jgi:hypothetical protein
MQLDLDNETSLLEALFNNHEHVRVEDLQPLISRLIERGADVNAYDWRAPRVAIMYDLPHLALLLDAKRAITNTIQADEGHSLLDLAVCHQRTGILELFLDHGMNPNMERNGQTLLSKARDIQLWEFAKLLTEKGGLLPEIMLGNRPDIPGYPCELCSNGFLPEQTSVICRSCSMAFHQSSFKTQLKRRRYFFRCPGWQD